MTTKLIRKHISRASLCTVENLKGRGIRTSHHQFFTTKNYGRSTCGHDVVQLTTLHKWTSTTRQFATKANATNNNNKNNNSSTNQPNSPISRRTEFKNIPINQSILSYIQTIGVGIRPRRSTRKKFSNANTSSTKNRLGNGGYRNRFSKNASHTLSINDEKAFFDRTSTRGKIRIRKKSNNNPSTTSTTTSTSTSTSTSTTSKNNENDVDDDDGNNKTSNQMWLPPPPFSTSGTNHNFIDHNIIKRLPVKIIGSVGSIQEEMPRSTKGLPEVAIIGRSNVGKSTLLNALLYGNQEVYNRKYIRGKTPEGAKLAKGVKAVVSNKPGETKRITFYQLSSQVFEKGNDEYGGGGENDKNDDGMRKKKKQSYKMSLVLADLPGYGFAFTSEEKADSWKEPMNTFLVKRGSSLKRILLLIDARHGFKNADFDFLDTLQNLRKMDSFGDYNKNDNSNGDRGEDGGASSQRRQGRNKITLPPIQIVLTKSDLVTQNDLARRVVQVREQLSDALIRETSSLPVMLCSAKAGLGYNNVRGEVAKGGILEIQRELAALVPKNRAK